MRLEDLHPVQSESEDIPLSKRRSHYVSSDSDLESYDVSRGRGKEPASGKLYKKKGISHKITHSLPKRILQEYKGIVCFTICNEDTLLIHCHVSQAREK